MTLKETEEYILKRILLHYDRNEARSIAKIALQHILKLSNLNYSLGYNNEVPPQVLGQVNQFVSQLQWAEPIQYIIGEANFMGFEFIVSRDVLIPRRETEELVEWIIEENRNKTPLKILDIGTGSGCIAIMLKKLLVNSEVFAMDVSDKALHIAEHNASRLRTDVQFIRGNILEMEDISFNSFDIIVSNPPYVTVKEKEGMHRNVVEFEPHLALFVPDNDPLVFYKKIAGLASLRLNKNGSLYFEVNESYAEQVKEVMESRNIKDVLVRKDMQGKDRMVRGIKD